MAPQGFAGFPGGKLKQTSLPDIFFAELLPAIDHLAELKLCLYTLWSLAQRSGDFRYLRRQDYAADRLFMLGLDAQDKQAQSLLDDALERAVARGFLLQVSAMEEQIYFLNSPRGREALRQIESGQWRPSGDPQAPVELSLVRPNIFNLYEQNIGPLTPMIAEILRDAENEYPADWVESAMRIAVENNVRKWRYVQAILEGWRDRGRDERQPREDTEKARRRYTEGEFSEYFDP